MTCPSSPLPQSIVLPNPLQVTITSVTLPTPTYAGISGTVPDISGIPVTAGWTTTLATQRSEFEQSSGPRYFAPPHPTAGTIGIDRGERSSGAEPVYYHRGHS